MIESEQPVEQEVADDSDFNALMQRSDELITQFFDLRRFIGGGEGVHVRQGIKNFIDTDP